VSKVRAANFAFSTMYLHYGDGKTIEMGTYCLLWDEWVMNHVFIAVIIVVMVLMMMKLYVLQLFELRVFPDPRADQCSECGIVTAANVARHVACRLQCVLPDLTGEMARLTH
jgi:hypothetical protein